MPSRSCFDALVGWKPVQSRGLFSTEHIWAKWDCLEGRDDGILAEIWARIQILQDSYNIYRSALFRAVVQHRDGAIPFTNVQASIRLSQQDPVEGGDLRRRLLLEPDLYVWTAKIALKDLARLVSEMVSKGTYEIGRAHV